MWLGVLLVGALVLVIFLSLREQARLDALPRCGDCRGRLGEGVATCPACGGRRG
jgi:hypothetical protein